LKVSEADFGFTDPLVFIVADYPLHIPPPPFSEPWRFCDPLFPMSPTSFCTLVLFSSENHESVDAAFSCTTPSPLICCLFNSPKSFPFEPGFPPYSFFLILPWDHRSRSSFPLEARTRVLSASLAFFLRFCLLWLGILRGRILSIRLIFCDLSALEQFLKFSCRLVDPFLFRESIFSSMFLFLMLSPRRRLGFPEPPSFPPWTTFFL